MNNTSFAASFDSKECEWADMEVFFEGVRVAKFTGLKWKKTQEKELMYVSGNEPASVQRGNKGYSSTFTVKKGQLDAMNAAVVAAGGEDILDASFTVVVNFKAKGARAAKTHTLVGYEITEFENGMEQGAKSADIALPALFLRLETV